MIPRLKHSNSSHPLIRKYFSELEQKGFCGDLTVRYVDRISLSTDNSIYCILPEGILYPQNKQDVILALRLANEPSYLSIKFSAKGGGTGTNGQFLTHGLIFDFSKYMNRIVEIDEKKGTATVEPGIPLDLLNQKIKSFGYFFSPNVSTANRATIGGMAANDSSGKGSMIYGKTSDHILEIEGAFFDGETFHSKITSTFEEALEAETSLRFKKVHLFLSEIKKQQSDLIEQRFLKMNRSLTAYNFSMLIDSSEEWNPGKILCGSEGTLCLFLELKLSLTPIPKFNRIVVIEYSDFRSALKHVEWLKNYKPLAVETMDETVMNLAKSDISWEKLEDFWGKNLHPKTETINIVEFVSDKPGEVERQSEILAEEITSAQNTDGALQTYIPQTASEASAFWEIRKKGVGLLANMQGNRRPIAFIEDCAVPPEVLADFITEFSELLKSRKLKYGMYGHADVGCMHVRPALDLTEAEDRFQIRTLSDEVNRLVRNYGGILWGEHGRGFRSEYSEEYFGKELIRSMRKLKKIFDPRNRMNPGKLFTPEGNDEKILKLDEVAFRGETDAQISSEVREYYPTAIYCNGNGECLNYKPENVMCPSSKITRDPVHSPKGRASILREWLRLTEKNGFIADPQILFQKPKFFGGFKKFAGIFFDRNQENFHRETYEAMTGCLSCKACVTQCPVHVDIPEFKARFLGFYHTRYLRPLRDLLLRQMESGAKILEFCPRLSNWGIQNRITSKILEKIGLVNAPKMSVPSFRKHLKIWRFRVCSNSQEPVVDGKKPILLLQDSFSRFYDAGVLKNAYLLLEKFGFRPYFAPYFPNGKPLHIKGFLREFRQIAENSCAILRPFSDRKIPILCVEPSVGLLFRDEYTAYLPGQKIPEVQLFQEFLATQTDLPQFKNSKKPVIEYKFFGHCTETTSIPQTFKQWEFLFSVCGLKINQVPVGCCGMAGVYGHEKKNLKESKGLYELSWKNNISSEQPAHISISGYSCRSQVKRMENFNPRHPVSVLFEEIRSEKPINRE